MRILVMNANTTEFVTETAAAEERAVWRPPGTEIVHRHRGIRRSHRGDTQRARGCRARGEVVIAARHAPGCDAVVIAVSYDTGLKALRELLECSGCR